MNMMYCAEPLPNAPAEWNIWQSRSFKFMFMMKFLRFRIVQACNQRHIQPNPQAILKKNSLSFLEKQQHFERENFVIYF